MFVFSKFEDHAQFFVDLFSLMSPLVANLNNYVRKNIEINISKGKNNFSPRSVGVCHTEKLILGHGFKIIILMLTFT